jgi:hypothetical protein
MKDLWNKSKRLLLELFIVFLGVFLAFQLNNYKEDKVAEALKMDYYTLILYEFEANNREINFAMETIDQYLAQIKAAKEKQTPSKIQPLGGIDLENNMLVIKSAFENGHLENLDSRYVSNLSLGSNALTRLSKAIDQYNLSVRAALQVNDWEMAAFYDSDQNIKEKYQWIIGDLENIRTYLENLKSALEKGAIPDTKALLGSK